MSDKRASAERREYTRFRVKEGIMVFTDSKPCQVIDISRGGISFRYVDNQERPICKAIDILSANNSIYLGNIPCRKIFDIKVAPLSASGALSIRRRGLQFEDFSHFQKAQLDHFISEIPIEP